MNTTPLRGPFFSILSVKQPAAKPAGELLAETNTLEFSTGSNTLSFTSNDSWLVLKNSITPAQIFPLIQVGEAKAAINGISVPNMEINEDVLKEILNNGIPVKLSQFEFSRGSEPGTLAGTCIMSPSDNDEHASHLELITAILDARFKCIAAASR